MAAKHKIIVGISGASGAVYAKVLLEMLVGLKEQIEDVALVLSDNARDVWKFELGNEDYKHFPFKVYEPADFFAPFASGSANYTTMIICPCSMGTMARIATGISNDLMTRAADVILKERRKLILVIRDTPFSLIHVRNMQTIIESGGIICPANPSFYSLPKTFEELAATVVTRVIDLAGLEQTTYRWQQQ